MKMADVFDIDSSGYHQKRDEYNNRSSGGWIPIEPNSVSRNKDPRLARRDDGRKHYSPGESPRRSPQRMSKSSSQSQMYNQMPPAQQYQQAPPPPPMYNEYNSGYGAATSSYSHNYQQSYQQSQNNSGFGQYNQQGSYPSQNQGYNSGQHQQPGPPGDEYPNSWAPVPPAYPNMSHPPPPPVPRPSSVTNESKTDDLKKEAAIAHEMKQQRATLIKQRDEYLRKASVIRRELEKLRMQKHDLLTEKSPPRDSQRVLRENAKLQLEIQNKLKSINNVVDMLSGIIGDGLKAGDEDLKANSSESSPKRSRKDSSSEGVDASGKARDEEWPHYNYIHYDPELHWCRVCDVFPRSAKDFLNHLHSAEHRQVTQEHQLVDTPWHKLPTDPELPSYKGAPVKRVPIKGLQFFISATSWYCKLCDVWIGDLHCASLHLKSKNHSHNYSHFVEQNPHWETNWLKDREKAYARCAKGEAGAVPPAPEPPVIKEKLNKKQLKTLKDKNTSFLESAKEKKRKKKSKKHKKNSSDSSSSSSSSDSSTEDESDKAKSIRVAMRNKMRMQAQMILNEEIGGKLEALRGLVEEKRREPVEEPPAQQQSAIEDNIINQWMTVTTNNDKHILDNLKGRLKQRQEADKEKSIEAAAEQRRREREREERELKELREREQRELEEKMREEREREERDRKERERIIEKERNRRKRRSDSRSPERGFGRGGNRSRGRSRSRSVGRRRYGRGRSPERFYRDERRDNRERRRSPEENFKPRKTDYDDDDYEKHEDYKGKGKRLVSTLSSRKLPFIGRMPLFKKRSDGEEKEIKKEDYEIRLSKFEPGNTARAFIPEPGVVHITKLATPPELMPLQSKISAENPPPPPKIIPEPPQISETAPPPPMINDVVTVVEETAMEVQDMELDEAAPPLPPGVPVAEAKPLAKPAGNHLPRDFQDALNIIFPGDQTHATDPNLLLQYQYQMGYGMMYPGMQMYDYSAAEETELVPEVTERKEATAEPEPTEEKTETAQPDVDDKEDLAMLGIDAEDMAAQTF